MLESAQNWSPNGNFYLLAAAPPPPKPWAMPHGHGPWPGPCPCHGPLTDRIHRKHLGARMGLV